MSSGSVTTVSARCNKVLTTLNLCSNGVLTCFNSHVTPKYLRLPNPEMKGYKAQNIIKKTERDLLNERIRQTNFTLDILKKKHQDIERKLRAELT